MNKTTGKFNRGENAGTAKCHLCGRLTLAGIENEHQDGYHETGSRDWQGGPCANCPMCHPDDPQFATYRAEGTITASEAN